MFLFITEDFMDLATELLFQYISCSYLSRSIPFFSLSSRNFNTSHVLIYQRAGLSGVQRIVNFNTSHVLIYLILLGTIKWIRHISIHLMFLFIAIDTGKKPFDINISIHLMFLFIEWPELAKRYFD